MAHGWPCSPRCATGQRRALLIWEIPVDHVKATQALRDAVEIIDDLKAALRTVSEALAAEPALSAVRKTADDDELLRPGQAADMLRVAVRTVWDYETGGLLPAVFTTGGHTRFRKADVKALLARLSDVEDLVRMHDVEGLTWAEIGRRQGKSRQAVAARYNRWVRRQPPGGRPRSAGLRGGAEHGNAAPRNGA